MRCMSRLPWMSWMSKVWPLVVAVTATASEPAAPELDDAEVRLPYHELQRLIEAGRDPKPVETRIPAVLGACHLQLSVTQEVTTIDAGFRTSRFDDRPSTVPLIGGDLALESIEPATTHLLLQNGMMCEAADRAGSSELEARFRVVASGEEFRIELPVCPSIRLAVNGPDSGRTLLLATGEGERLVEPGSEVALDPESRELRLRWLDAGEREERLQPPVPSTWRWQHQALVFPDEDELGYLVLAHGSAAAGSGVEAVLELPAEARGITATGEDLKQARATRNEDGSWRLRLDWNSRDVLERDVEFQYRVPRRPLDRSWQLAVPAGPGDGATQARFVLPSTPAVNLSATGMEGPTEAEGLPAAFRELLGGSSYYLLEGEARATVEVRRLPVVATEDVVIENAVWFLGLEPDGAFLLTGGLEVGHGSSQRILLELPEGMSLLSCHVQDRGVDPIDRGDGRLEIVLPVPPGDGNQPTRVGLSLTGRVGAFDPLEGVLPLSLPRTSVFIRSLAWQIQLPGGYRAEVDGNLVRMPVEGSEAESLLKLNKRICRGERPEARVFYQSAHESK